MPGDLETINPGRESASKFNRIHAKLAERGVISSDGSVLIDSTPVGINLRVRQPFIPPARTIPFILVSDATGGGKYNGKTLVAGPASDVSASGSVAAADVGTFATDVDCLCLNVREQGASTHDLDAASFTPLIFFGYLVRVNSDGLKVIAFDGAQQEDCTTP